MEVVQDVSMVARVSGDATTVNHHLVRPSFLLTDLVTRSGSESRGTMLERTDFTDSTVVKNRVPQIILKLALLPALPPACQSCCLAGGLRKCVLPLLCLALPLPSTLAA